MAIPIPPPASRLSDLVTLKDVVALMSETPHPVSMTTLRRWIKGYGIPVIRVEKAHKVSYSLLAEAQRDEAEREAVARRRPEP
ncbi:hypothetical protein ACFV27_36895 [Streptomyces antimycoticus]|uniref:hypothetical protein n=1 Tax=Streptomyces antimycoticus TaxID=68175 RepID=UPI00367E8D95